MWFLLLIALSTGEYRAEIVLKDKATCEQHKQSVEDLCVPVWIVVGEDTAEMGSV